MVKYCYYINFVWELWIFQNIKYESSLLVIFYLKLSLWFISLKHRVHTWMLSVICLEKKSHRFFFKLSYLLLRIGWGGRGTQRKHQWYKNILLPFHPHKALTRGQMFTTEISHVDTGYICHKSISYYMF